jgi:uncharacterized protein
MPDIVIAFFALGLLAGLLKSDLKVPSAIYETLTILLMLALGIKGGLSLHSHTGAVRVGDLALIALYGALIPMLLYPVLRRAVRLGTADAASIAAHFGSVSAATFAVAVAFADTRALPLFPETSLYLVVLELPAIVAMLLFHRRHSARPVSTGSVWHEALTNRGVMLLAGGIVLGWAYGPQGLAPIEPALIGGFQTFLALFLLEMGICTAAVCRPLPWQHWRVLVFAALAPFALAWCGIALALLLDLPAGSALVLTALSASASYIAAPAIVRKAMPEANAGLAMLAALGVTFPINVLVGIPLYFQWVMLFQ